MHVDRPNIAWLAMLLLVGSVGPVPAAPPEYTIEVLEGSAIHIDDMNLHGEVVGWTTDGGGGYDIEFLGALPGHTQSVGQSVAMAGARQGG